MKSDKENDGNGTPIKKSTASSLAAQENAVLSPTPYYKVVEERGGQTSPRLTRSAVKRQQQQTAMEELDQLGNNNTNNNSDDEEGDSKTPLPHGGGGHGRGLEGDEFDSARISLQFQKPDRHDWQRRQSKVRKSVQPSGRNSKRTKYNNSSSNEQQQQQPAMNADQVRQIMTETLQSSQNEQLLQLSAAAASSQKEVEVYKLQLEQLTDKHSALEEMIKLKEGSEGEIRMKLMESNGMVDKLQKELEVIKCEKEQLEEQCVKDGDGWSIEKEELERHHADNIQRMEMELQQVKKAHDELEIKSNETLSELEDVKTKLEEANRYNEELEKLQTAASGNNSELVERLAKLEREKVDLMQCNLNNEREVTTLTLQLDTKTSEYEAQLQTVQREHEEVLSQKEDVIQHLQSELDNTRKTMEGMTSPNSKETMESEYKHELEVLRNEKMAMNQLLKQLNVKNEELIQQLDESKDENATLQEQLGGLQSQFEGDKVSAVTELEKENMVIAEQLNSTTIELKKNKQQLEDLAMENEQVVAKLDEREGQLKQTMDQMEGQLKQLNDMELQLNNVMSEKETLFSKNVSLATELSDIQDQVSTLQSEVGSLKDDLVISQQRAEMLGSQKNESDEKLHELSNQLQSLTTLLESSQGTITTLEDKLRAKDEYCEQFESIERKLIHEKNVLNEMRRTLHNKVIQLTGNIRVYIRVRPLIPSEQQLTTSSSTVATIRRPSSASGGGRPSSASGRPSSRGGSIVSSSSQQQRQDEQCFHFPGLADRNVASKSPNYTSFSDLSKQTIELTEPHRDRGGLNPRRKKWKYGFDKVFNPVNDQADVWDGAEPLVQSAVDGHKVCMFAYGQTGSGKTHTMIGDSVNRGLIPRAVEKLFASKKEIEQSFQGDVSVSIKVELLEIYNEEVYDLLDAEAGPKGQKMKIKLNSNEAVNNIVVEASSQDEVQGVLQLAQQRRCVKATKSNSESSRSHLLFTVRFEVSSLTNEDMLNRQGVLHIVDLAGSERLDKSGSQGTLLTEAKHINTSLSALSHVMQKLQDKSEHIPYRDSKLTYLLRDSLGGDSKTLCIVCCSPHQTHFNESLNSIRFAANASKVELKQGNKVDV